MTSNTLLELKPIKKFIAGVGEQIKAYIGKDPACIIGLEDDGVFYARGLYHWLSQSNKKITLTTMDDYGRGLEKEKVKNRKVLLVDNDIVTGKAFREIMDFMTRVKDELVIKDIKFAVLCDRMKVADFSVEDYPMPSSWDLKHFDKIDLKIIRTLCHDGRATFVDIAKEINLTPVGVKKRVERLLDRGVMNVKGSLDAKKFYSVSAAIGIEANPEAVDRLIKKFASCPLVYNLVKVSGNHNLVVGLIAPSLSRIHDLVEKQIRSDTGIRLLEIDLGELPIVPKTHCLAGLADTSKKCPCPTHCNECEYFL
ncbi:MAG: AsnC family transcriptional regulator [Patescibacteria group bacterium]